MKILITGNMGYVGPRVVAHLRNVFPDVTLIGADVGLFGPYLSNAKVLPEVLLDVHHFCDVRELGEDVLRGVDAVVHLAGVSNDPIGNQYEEVTLEINHRASIGLAARAKAAGVHSFVFASSCSAYGLAEDGARSEESEVNPLTVYAKSKVYTERDLRPLAGDDFRVTCLRFATACGMSERLRLDLVLNDFVATAVATGRINILSDGSPWRPLIDVNDMARAIEWAIVRDADAGGNYLVVNAGSEEANHQVRDLAAAVAAELPGTTVSINANAQPDKRSYRVDFSLFRRLAPQHQPAISLRQSIQGLREGLTAIGYAHANVQDSMMIRLRVIALLRNDNYITPELRWISSAARRHAADAAALQPLGHCAAPQGPSKRERHD
jgi:nucleoside-diphosphate-sugar epimerase